MEVLPLPLKSNIPNVVFQISNRGSPRKVPHIRLEPGPLDSIFCSISAHLPTIDHKLVKIDQNSIVSKIFRYSLGRGFSTTLDFPRIFRLFRPP